MNLSINPSVFLRRGVSRPRREVDLMLGADAYVVPEPAFVTGLRDWRRIPATSTSQTASRVIDAEWQPI